MNPEFVFQVSEFNEVANRHLSLLGEVVIEGELGRLDIKNNLIFGTIKDKYSTLDIFSLTYKLKNFRQFEPGMLVRIWASPGLYKASGKFRLEVRDMIPQGEGALQLAFEKLKSQLEAEGLFAPERKRPLPAWPQRIGLITAVPSSAYHDVVKILSARMGGISIKALPVSVQGRDALPSLTKAFAYINSHAHDFDVVIMARGGGSLEDLAAFNTEDLARAVFSCKVPVVSAIGHEDNWSLTDYVADVRASTPSNAAELTVKDRKEVIAEVDSLLSKMHVNLISKTYTLNRSVASALSTIRQAMRRHTDRISQVVQRSQTLGRILKHQVEARQHQLEHLDRLLQSLDYRNVLKRGYSITTDKSGAIIKSAVGLKTNDTIITQLAKGSIYAKVDHTR